MDKKCTLKELIVQNNLCETKYKDYFSNGKIASSNNICFPPLLLYVFVYFCIILYNIICFC